MGRHNDKKIVKDAQKNASAYEKIYEKYAGPIYKYFWYRVGRITETAEDLMQETFTRAFERLSYFKDQGVSYFSYLLKIAHNLLVNYYRSRKSFPLEKAEEIPVQLETDLERKLEASILKQAIASLNEHERAAIELYYHQRLPIRTIASTMGKTENAVKLLLSRTRKKLALHPLVAVLAPRTGRHDPGTVKDGKKKTS